VGVKDTNVEEASELDTSKRRGGVVLSPQPSDDVNDPLNWASSSKWLHLIVLAFGSALANATTTMLTPGLEPLTEHVKSNAADVSTWLLTAPTFWTSAAAFIVVSGADIYGRRTFYFWSMVLLALTNYLGYFSTTFPMVAFSRTLAGLVSAPVFTLVTATISDIFFVHERGLSIAVWNVLLNAGAQVGSVIAGLVTDRFGVMANFLFVAIMFTLMIPVVYLSTFETAYFNRKTEDVTSITVSPNKLTSEWDEDEFNKAANLPAKLTFKERLPLTRGQLSNKSFLKGIVKPLGLLSSPLVIYSCFINAVMFLFLAGVPTFVSILLSGDAYKLSPSQIGLTNLPLFFGGLIFSPAFGWLSDASVRIMAVHNGSTKGVAEPEFRLVLLLLSTPVTVVGLIGLGTAFQNNLPLAWVIVWMTVTNIGAVSGVQLAISYVIDCLPDHSAQAFTSVNMISAGAVTVGLSPLIGLLEADGPLVLFGCLASSAVIVTGMALPLYVFGKKIRAWYQAQSWAEKLLD